MSLLDSKRRLARPTACQVVDHAGVPDGSGWDRFRLDKQYRSRAPYPAIGGYGRVECSVAFIALTNLDLTFCDATAPGRAARNEPCTDAPGSSLPGREQGASNCSNFIPDAANSRLIPEHTSSGPSTHAVIMTPTDKEGLLRKRKNTATGDRVLSFGSWKDVTYVPLVTSRCETYRSTPRPARLRSHDNDDGTALRR